MLGVTRSAAGHGRDHTGPRARGRAREIPGAARFPSTDADLLYWCPSSHTRMRLSSGTSTRISTCSSSSPRTTAVTRPNMVVRPDDGIHGIERLHHEGGEKKMWG